MRSMVEPLEKRCLLAAAPTVGLGESFTLQAGQPQYLLEADGSLVIFKLAGQGVASITPDGDAFDVSITGSTNRTAMTIVAKTGDKTVTLDDITADAPLRAISAATARVTGDVRIPWIASLAVRSMEDGDVETSYLGKLVARESVSMVDIDSPFIGTMSVGGNLSNVRLALRPTSDDQPHGLRKLAVRGSMTDSTIDALTDIGTVSAAAMHNSTVAAGVRWEYDVVNNSFVAVLPKGEKDTSKSDVFDFTGRYKVAKVVVSGRVPDSIAFSDSRIVSHHVGRVSLNKVEIESGGTKSGVSGYRVDAVTRRFERQGAHLNRKDVRSIDFSVNQIVEPIVFNPSTGSYGASFTLSSGASVTLFIGTNGPFTPHVLTPATPPLILNEQVATVSNDPAGASGVYLITDGSYVVRNSAGDVLASSTSLAALIDGLIGLADKSIKAIGTKVLRSTSVGPVVELVESAMGRSYTVMVDEALYNARAQQLNSGLSLSDKHSWRNGIYFNSLTGSYEQVHRSFLIPNASNGTESYRAPSTSELFEAMRTGGRTVESFDAMRLKQDDAPLRLGVRYDFGVQSEITIVAGLLIEVQPDEGDAYVATTVSQALYGDGSKERAGGSRRVYAQYEEVNGQSFIYGLRGGGTTVYWMGGENILDPHGNVLSIPSVK